MIRSCAALFFIAALARADQSCLWLDAPTAAAVLGGPVTVKVNKFTCRFTLRQSRGSSELQIDVHRFEAAHEKYISYRSHCGRAAMPLKAIGNEAFVCAKNHEVIGRVRDALFKVRLPANRDRRLEELAEQVAGSLF